MKTFYTILKILAVLVAIAAIVFVVVAYGDKIVAWAKKLLGCTCECECNCDCDCECECECEEAPVEEEAIAEEKDFEGQ